MSIKKGTELADLMKICFFLTMLGFSVPARFKRRGSEDVSGPESLISRALERETRSHWDCLLTAGHWCLLCWWPYPDWGQPKCSWRSYLKVLPQLFDLNKSKSVLAAPETEAPAQAWPPSLPMSPLFMNTQSSGYWVRGGPQTRGCIGKVGPLLF